MSLVSSVRFEGKLGFWSGERAEFSNWSFLASSKLKILNPRYAIYQLNPWADVLAVIEEAEEERIAAGKLPAQSSSSTATSTSSSSGKSKMEHKVTTEGGDKSSSSSTSPQHPFSASDILLEEGDGASTPASQMVSQKGLIHISPYLNRKLTSEYRCFQSSDGLVVKQPNILVPDFATAIHERRALSYLLLTAVQPQVVKGTLQQSKALAYLKGVDLQIDGPISLLACTQSPFRR